MISIKSSFYSKDKWLAFPGFLVSFNRLSLPMNFFLSNRPGLEHCFSVVETSFSIENLSFRFDLSYPLLSDIQFERYTIISARTQGKLNKKLSWLGLYNRSSYVDSLDNLKWISADYHWASSSDKFVKFIDSPILLFDSSRVRNLIWDWCSAFISFLSFGCLNIVVSHGSFHLGRVEFRFSNLLRE